MEKTMYAVVESYSDYKCNDASIWGVCSTIEKAQEKLRGVLEELFDYIRVEVDDDEWNKWVNDGFTDEFKTRWEHFDGDSEFKFYIDDVVVEED